MMTSSVYGRLGLVVDIEIDQRVVAGGGPECESQRGIRGRGAGSERVGLAIRARRNDEETRRGRSRSRRIDEVDQRLTLLLDADECRQADVVRRRILRRVGVAEDAGAIAPARGA